MNARPDLLAPTSHTVIASSPAALIDIFQPDVQLAVWQRPDEVSGLIGADTRIESVASFSVALLKGSLWQGNGGRGVIHRSPAIPVDALPRVVLALDGMW